jgi:hypothetical protein
VAAAGGDDITMTLVRPDDVRVPMNTKRNALVVDLMVDYVAAFSEGGGLQKQLDSMRFVIARSRQMDRQQTVGHYVDQYPDSDITVLFTMRGGAPKPKKSVEKDTGKRRDKLLLARAKVDQALLRRMRSPLATELSSKAVEIRDSPETYVKQLIGSLNMDQCNELIDFINDNTGEGKHAARSLVELCHFFFPQIKGVDGFLKEVEEAKQQVYIAFNLKLAQAFMNSGGHLKLVDIIDEIEDHKAKLLWAAHQQVIQRAAQQQAEMQFHNIVQHMNMQVVMQQGQNMQDARSPRCAVSGSMPSRVAVRSIGASLAGVLLAPRLPPFPFLTAVVCYRDAKRDL